MNETDLNVEPSTSKKKQKKKKQSSENMDFKIESEEFQEATGQEKDDEPTELNFPTEQLPQLLARVEKFIPDNDIFTYISRSKKIDWNGVAFGEYSADRCRDAWLFIQKRQRHYRILGEVLSDAKEWIRTPWQNFNKGVLSRLHPDFPKKPASSYLIFYLEAREKIMKENPEITLPDLVKATAALYSQLTDVQKKPYADLAAEKLVTYEQEVKQFFEKHPEIIRVEKPSEIKVKVASGGGSIPKKPPTPFVLFFNEQLKITENVTDRAAFKETCKEQFKNLPEKKKMVWIQCALKMQEQYQEELKEYANQHPDFIVKDNRVLTKEEISLKERMEGKPEKPPNSAYGLYSSMQLRSDDYKTLESRDRLKLIAGKWKTLSEEEKQFYKEQTQALNEKYKQDFEAYILSLPEDKREEELAKTKRKTGKFEAELIAAKRAKENEDLKPNPLKDYVLPSSWDHLDEREKSLYFKYIKKVKDYFDEQHKSALENTNAQDSSGDSDSFPE